MFIKMSGKHCYDYYRSTAAEPQILRYVCYEFRKKYADRVTATPQMGLAVCGARIGAGSRVTPHVLPQNLAVKSGNPHKTYNRSTAIPQRSYAVRCGAAPRLRPRPAAVAGGAR